MHLTFMSSWAIAYFPYICILLVAFLFLESSATVIEEPECEPWAGTPRYSHCLEALNSFVNTVTNHRGYTLDERIEFRPRVTSPQRYPELPSELLSADLYTFFGGDLNEQIRGLSGQSCVIGFSASILGSHLTMVSTFGELKQLTESVIEKCVYDKAQAGSGLISSELASEYDIQIGPLVSALKRGNQEKVSSRVKASLEFLGERKLGGNPWLPGGPNPWPNSDRPKTGDVPQGSETPPVQSAFCNANHEHACWPGLRCSVVKFVNGAKQVLWGLKVGEFIGSCISDGVES